MTHESDHRNVTLTEREIAAMEAEIGREIARLGPPPSVEELRHKGYSDSSALNSILDSINGIGRIINLLIAEIIQSIGTIVLVIVFGVLEYWRVHNGAATLGQADQQASLIAFAVVTGNVIIPIYSLKQLRGRKSFVIQHRTVRGYFSDFLYRLKGKPRTEEADLYYNPTLNFAAMVLTYGTIFLAIYDLLAPLLTSIFEGKTDKPLPILFIELMMGFSLSVAGVFFLQSAAHAIGVRTLVDNAARLIDIAEMQRIDYQRQVEDIRIEIKAKHEGAKADRLEQRLAALEQGVSQRRLPAVSKTTKDTLSRRNPNARRDFEDWFNNQSPETREDVLSGAISLRKAGEQAGVDKEVVRRHLDNLKMPKPSTNGNGRR